MPGPTEAQLGAVRTLIETAPDAALRSLEAALANAHLGPMAMIRDIVQGEQAERDFRCEVFAPVAPLFTPARGMARPAFPARVAAALWRELRERHPDQIAQADHARARWRPEDPEPPIFDELCAEAAVILREDPGAVFRAGDADAAMAETLAAYFDLAPMARMLLRRLPEWLGKATDERVAALKLVFRDATAKADDATPRLLELVAAHLPEPQQILRLISILTDRAGDRYLSSSELAVFGVRLLDDVEARIGRIRTYDTGSGPEGARAVSRDTVAVCAVLAEMEATLDLSRDGPWGARVTQARKTLASTVEGRLREVEGLVDKALPLQTVRIAGRMTRPAPKVATAPDERLVEKARSLLVLLEETRAGAAVGGYGALRNQVAEKVSDRLGVYADELIHLINAGEAPDEDLARTYLEIAAEFLAYADPAAAQIVRRRAAVAGERHQPSQDVA